MISYKQIESIVLDDISYCGILIAVCVMSFGVGMLLGAIWLL